MLDEDNIMSQHVCDEIADLNHVTKSLSPCQRPWTKKAPCPKRLWMPCLNKALWELRPVLSRTSNANLQHPWQNILAANYCVLPFLPYSARQHVEHVANAANTAFLLTQQVPAEMGGVDLNFTAACLAIEEVAKVDPAVSALMDRA